MKVSAIINENTIRKENAHTLFRQSKNMYEIAFLSDIFNEEDVLYLGNCGFEALILCLWYAGLLPKIVHPMESEQWTENERRNDLASWRRAIAKIRSLMYRFYISNLREFRGLACEVDPDPPLEVTVAGTFPPEPLAEFKGREFRLRERAEHIYNSLHDYDNDGCVYADYMQSHWWAIAARKWKRTFVVYNEGNRSKQTVVFHWDAMEQKVIVYTYSGVLLSPPYGALCVVCLPDICHYKYLKDNRVSLDQLYTVLPFIVGLFTDNIGWGSQNQKRARDIQRYWRGYAARKLLLSSSPRTIGPSPSSSQHNSIKSVLPGDDKGNILIGDSSPNKKGACDIQRYWRGYAARNLLEPFAPRANAPSPSSSPHNSIQSVLLGDDNANIELGYGDNDANDITDVYGKAESTAAFASANPEESTTHTSVKKKYGGMSTESHTSTITDSNISTYTINDLVNLSDSFLTSTNGSTDYTEDEVANKNSISHFLTWLSTSNELSKTTAPAGPYSSMARSNASDSASSVLQFGHRLRATDDAATTTLSGGTKNSSPFAAASRFSSAKLPASSRSSAAASSLSCLATTSAAASSLSRLSTSQATSSLLPATSAKSSTSLATTSESMFHPTIDMTARQEQLPNAESESGSSLNVSDANLRAMARVPHQDTVSYFVNIIRIGNIPHEIYRPIDQEYHVTIMCRQLEDVIVTRMNGNELSYFELSPGGKTGKSDIIHQLYNRNVKDGNLPAHVVPSFREVRRNTPSSLRNKKGAAGRGSKYPGALIFEGPCKHNGRTNKTDLKRMWHNPDNGDKCTGWCQVVLTQDQVVKFATNTENVALSLTVNYMGRCIHEVGREKGTLSGAERKRKANEIMKSSKSPKEFVKACMTATAKNSPSMFLCNNTSGRLKNAKQVVNLRYEAKQEAKRQRGIIPMNSIEAILKTMQNIVTKDLEGRVDKRANGGNTLPGNVRRCNFVPTPDTANVLASTPIIAPDFILHERSLCSLAGELSETSHIVVSLDSTGAMLNFQNTAFDGKILHSMLMLHLKESSLSKEDFALTRPGDFSSVCLSERASSWNTASAIRSWVTDVIVDVKSATRDVLGRPVDFTVGLVRSDNAYQFPTGMIEAFRKVNHIDSSRGYNNITMALIIRHEKTTINMDPSSKRYKSCCEFVVSNILMYCPFCIAICSVHTYLYRRDAYKHMKNKPPQLKPYFTQVNRLYGNMSHQLLREDCMTSLIVRMAVLVVLFESETIPCGNITSRSRVHDGHDASAALMMANTMHQLIIMARDSLLSSITDEKVDNVIVAEHQQVGSSNKQRFKGCALAGEVLQIIGNSIKFSISYPQAIDRKKNTCTVRTAIIYSPYEVTALPDGSWDSEIKPKIVGGFETTVKLPYRKGFVPNPLHSKELARYWRQEIDRVGMTSNAVCAIAGTAWGRNIFPNNMSLEAYIDELKNRNERSRNCVTDVPSWMVSKFEESVENATLVSRQIVSHPSKLRRRKAQAASRVVMSSGQPREEDLEAVWSSGNKGIPAKLGLVWERMVQSLDGAMVAERNSRDADKYLFQMSNAMSIFRVLEHVSTKMDGENLCSTNFYEWYGGNRKKNLPDDFEILIDGMYNKYVVSVQRYKVGTKVRKVFYRPNTTIEANYLGYIDSYSVRKQVYLVRYDDGDIEEITEENIAKIVVK